MNHKLRDAITGPQMHRKVSGYGKLAARSMDCKYHPVVPLSLAVELPDVTVQDALRGRTLDLHERDLICGPILRFKVNPLEHPSQGGGARPSLRVRT